MNFYPPWFNEIKRKNPASSEIRLSKKANIQIDSTYLSINMLRNLFKVSKVYDGTSGNISRITIVYTSSRFMVCSRR